MCDTDYTASKIDWYARNVYMFKMKMIEDQFDNFSYMLRDKLGETDECEIKTAMMKLLDQVVKVER